MSGYSGTPLALKLGIRTGTRLHVHAPPQHYTDLLAPLPQGVQMSARVGQDTDIIHIFAQRRTALATKLRRALQTMRQDAAIWVSWPKKSSGVTTDISEDVIREIALPLTLVDVKVCAVDEVWSGLKLVIRRSARTPAVAAERGKSRHRRRAPPP